MWVTQAGRRHGRLNGIIPRLDLSTFLTANHTHTHNCVRAQYNTCIYYTRRALDNVQTAVFTSVKSAQYVRILLLGRKQTSRIPRGRPTSDFLGDGVSAVYQSAHHWIICLCLQIRFFDAELLLFDEVIQCYNNSLISKIEHTAGKGCPCAEIYLKGRCHGNQFCEKNGKLPSFVALAFRNGMGYIATSMCALTAKMMPLYRVKISWTSVR